MTGKGEPMNETLQTIMNRKSVRSYRADPIPKEKLELIVKAGMAAPTAVDKRPWEFVVITDKALLKQLADALPYAKMAEQAGAAILVAGDVDRQHGGRAADYWMVDCAAAAENILLAVESLGLGAVWTAVYPEQERIEAVRELLKVPSSIVPLAFIPIGAPAGDQKPIKKKEGKYDYDTLSAILKEVKKTYPDKRDVHIASDDTIQYQYIIQAMDTALTAQFPDIALTDINAAHL